MECNDCELKDWEAWSKEQKDRGYLEFSLEEEGNWMIRRKVTYVPDWYQAYIKNDQGLPRTYDTLVLEEHFVYYFSDVRL